MKLVLLLVLSSTPIACATSGADPISVIVAERLASLSTPISADDVRCAHLESSGASPAALEAELSEMLERLHGAPVELAYSEDSGNTHTACAVAMPKLGEELASRLSDWLNAQAGSAPASSDWWREAPAVTHAPASWLDLSEAEFVVVCAPRPDRCFVGAPANRALVEDGGVLVWRDRRELVEAVSGLDASNVRAVRLLAVR